MINLRRILCPTDLSPESDEALRYAIALARAYDAKLVMSHCIESPSFNTESGREQIRKTIEDGVSSHLVFGGPSSLDYEISIFEGTPDTCIPQTAAMQHVDLIVMRSRRRPIAAALLGSTAEAVCRTAPCPVLVTHPHEHEWVGKTTGEIDLKKILVAHDFSIDSELALSYGLLLAQEYQAEVHLMHVLPYAPAPVGQGMSMGETDAFEQASKRLQESIPEEVYLWCKVRQVIRSGQPYREILTYAEEEKIDLVCMGVHGAGFAMRALFGSNADRVLRQAPCPVLITRPLKPYVKEA
ncbi:MAG: universal stress protein [Blastocatellales bacterium]